MVKRFIYILLAIFVLLGLNAAFSRGLNPYYLQIVIEVGIAIILAVSLNIINGFTGQFSLGHAGFMAIGAYSSAAISFYYSPQMIAAVAQSGIGIAAAQQVVFVGMLFISALTAALAGLLVGLPTLRLRGDYLAIATLGFGEIIRLVINNRPEVGGASGFQPFVAIPQYVSFFWVYLFVLFTIVLASNLLRSVHGRALLSIREDELAAQVMGVPITYYKVLAFVIGATLAGIAGCLTAHYNRALHPNDFDFIASIMIVVMVVLGGMGSIIGVTIAAVALYLVSYMLRNMLGVQIVSFLIALVVLALLLSGRRMPRRIKGTIFVTLLAAMGVALLQSESFLAARVPELRMLLFSVLLVVLMLTRPQGLLGAKEISWKGIIKWKRLWTRRQGNEAI